MLRCGALDGDWTECPVSPGGGELLQHGGGGDDARHARQVDQPEHAGELQEKAFKMQVLHECRRPPCASMQKRLQTNRPGTFFFFFYQ